MTFVTFIPGTSKTDKATYKVGKTLVPAALITRKIPEIQAAVGNPRLLARLATQVFSGKYEAVLDAAIAANIPDEAIFDEFAKVAPVKKAAGEKRGTKKSQKLAGAVAKLICVNFSGGCGEAVSAFLAAVNNEEFQKGVLEEIQAFEHAHGRDLNTNKVRVRAKLSGERKAAMQKARKK